MATLYIDGIDEEIITQLQSKAKQFNTNINELTTQFIAYGLKNYPETKPSNINSLFGLVASSTDGVEFQNAMREE
ncbi:hypothetical protein TI05_13955 [Achromatium sp. WMS3]|nr:hypothetical protein TI05_13955 [Achromatium sp. WMS3]